jgi:hypothetical protein
MASQTPQFRLDGVPATVTAELHALKLRLISMGPDELPEDASAAMAAEISAIRLQLKRLEADRGWP